jgi:hypothetical protein
VKPFNRVLLNRRSRLPALAPFLLLAVSSLFPTPARTQTNTATQHFVCNTGYTLKQCQEAMVSAAMIDRMAYKWKRSFVDGATDRVTGVLSFRL